MRRNKRPLRRFFLILPLLFSAVLAPALGRQDGGGRGIFGGGEKPKTVRVTGRVRLTGSGPGMELVITGPDREWRIDKKDQDKLWDLQQQTVTVEGRETSKEMKFANGTSAGTWYYLENVKIIEPKPEK
ncbi:hypothetical protein AGMMS49546_02720 [Spirochaetia bacterium]|nr:hypothetical protein AGMMS49546_02720 [Spirochaetia bacterium]